MTSGVETVRERQPPKLCGVTEFLEFTERETETRIGNSDPRPFAPKMFPNLAEPS